MVDRIFVHYHDRPHRDLTMDKKAGRVLTECGVIPAVGDSIVLDTGAYQVYGREFVLPDEANPTTDVSIVCCPLYRDPTRFK